MDNRYEDLMQDITDGSNSSFLNSINSFIIKI